MAALLSLGLSAAGGHIPVPDSVLNPKTPEEAWNILRLSTENVARLINEDRLAEVPDQISLCAPALRYLKSAETSPELKRQVAMEAVQSSVAITSLAQAGVSGDRVTTLQVLAALRGHLASLAAFYDAKVVLADLFSCPMHPDCVSASADARCAKCGMGLLLRRIPYSFVYVPAGEPSIWLSAKADAKLSPGHVSQVKVRLTRHDDSPVLLTDLLVMHTQPIHLLMVDPALNDYHHEHPVPTDVPGEYAFSFIPATKSSYRIFADLVPAATGVQEYPWTDLPSAADIALQTNVQAADTFSARADGFDFDLAVGDGSGKPPRAGQVCELRVTVKDATSGKPVDTLEPVMGAFAHLVGFYGDRRTVVHLHPLGVETVDPGARGGPALEFKFYPPKAGFIRLYCQIQIHGRAVYCPFNMNVAP